MMKMMTTALLALALLTTACQNDAAQPKDDAPPTNATSAPAKAADSAPAKEAPKADAPKADECKAIAGAAEVKTVMGCMDVFQGGEDKIEVIKTQADLDALFDKHGESCKGNKPTFDFEKVTVLGTVVSGTCSVTANAKACMAAAGPVLSVEVSEEGDCERMAVQSIWMTVPKMAEGQTASHAIKRK